MSRRRIENIIVHWSATGPLVTTEDIRRWHKAQGWKDIGYHRVIEHEVTQPKDIEVTPGRLIKVGRQLNTDLFIEATEAGAHTLGYNSNSIGICVIAGPQQGASTMQIEALLLCLDIFCKRFNLPKTAVKGHRDFNATECPGRKIYDVLKRFKGE